MRGHPDLGKRTRRFFSYIGGPTDGQIVAFVPASDDGQDEALWKNRHDDGELTIKFYVHYYVLTRGVLPVVT